MEEDPLRLALSNCALAPSAAAEVAALYELPREAEAGSTVSVDLSFNTGATPFCAVAGIALAVLRCAASTNAGVSVAIDCRHTHFGAAPTHGRFPETRSELDRLVSAEYPVPADVQARRDALDFAFDGEDDHAACPCASGDFDGLVGDFLQRVAKEQLPLAALQLHQCFVAPALGKNLAHAAAGVTAVGTLRRLDVSFLPLPQYDSRQPPSRSQVHQTLELRRLERALPSAVAAVMGADASVEPRRRCDFHGDEDVIEVARSLSSGSSAAATSLPDDATHVASAASSSCSSSSSCGDAAGDDSASDVDAAAGPAADHGGSTVLVFADAEMLAPFGPSDPPLVPKPATVPAAGAVPSRWVAPSTNPVPPKPAAAVVDGDDAAKPKKRKVKKVKKGSKKKKADGKENAAAPAAKTKTSPVAPLTTCEVTSKATCDQSRHRRNASGGASLAPAAASRGASLLRQAPSLVARAALGPTSSSSSSRLTAPSLWGASMRS